MTHRSLPVLLLAVSTAAACSRTDAGGGAVAVRDSAGIQVVESARPAWAEGQGWTVDDAPALDVGVVEGAAAYQLSDVAGAARLPDGTIVVADGGSKELRFFGADGRHLRSVGRDGSGPGEFRGLAWVGAIRGDSVAVWDAQLTRLSVFDREGRFARSVQPRGITGMGPDFLGMFADGSFVVTEGFDPLAFSRRAGGAHRDSASFRRFGADGAPAGTVARIPGMEAFLIQEGTGGFVNADVVFGRNGALALAGEGFWTGDTDAFSLVSHGTDGKPARVVRRAHEPVAVTVEHLDIYFDREEKSIGKDLPPAFRQHAAQLLESLRHQRKVVPHRETFPAWSALRPDADGNLWVREYAPPVADDAGPQPAAWSVFAPDGRWLGTVRTPAGLEVRQIGPDWILGTAKDELDVEHVRLYRLTKPAAR